MPLRQGVRRESQSPRHRNPKVGEQTRVCEVGVFEHAGFWQK